MMQITWQKMVPELIVLDFSRSLAFYTQVLGFTVLYARHDPEFVYLEQGDLQLMLLEAEGEMWLDAPLERPLGRGVNLQMDIDDVQPIYDRLIAAQAPLHRDLNDIWRETGEGLTGSREVWFQDPDGYLLRFCQTLGSKPDTGTEPSGT